MRRAEETDQKAHQHLLVLSDERRGAEVLEEDARQHGAQVTSTPPLRHDGHDALPVVGLRVSDQQAAAGRCGGTAHPPAPAGQRRLQSGLLELAYGLRPAIELGQAAPILGRKTVLELVEVVVEIGGAEVVELGGGGRGLEGMPGAAIARGDERRFDGARLVGTFVEELTPHGAHGVDHRQAGDEAPFLAEVVAVRVDAGPQDVERLVADQQQPAEVGERLGERTLTGGVRRRDTHSRQSTLSRQTEVALFSVRATLSSCARGICVNSWIESTAPNELIEMPGSSAHRSAWRANSIDEGRAMSISPRGQQAVQLGRRALDDSAL